MKPLLALSFTLIGCSSTPDLTLEQRYIRQPWARMSLYEAEAVCRNEVVGGLAPNMPLCMRARGWLDRRY